MLVLTRPDRPGRCFRVTGFLLVLGVAICTRKNMAKKAGGIAPFKILARIHFNLQVVVCPAKIWSVLRTYHYYINPNTRWGITTTNQRLALAKDSRGEKRHAWQKRKGGTFPQHFGGQPSNGKIKIERVMGPGV